MTTWMKSEFGQLTTASVFCLLSFLFLYAGIRGYGKFYLGIGSLCLVGSMVLPIISAFKKKDH